MMKREEYDLETAHNLAINENIVRDLVAQEVSSARVLADKYESVYMKAQIFASAEARIRSLLAELSKFQSPIIPDRTIYYIDNAPEMRQKNQEDADNA